MSYHEARFVACVLAIAVGILVSATASIVQATVIMDATHDNGWFTAPAGPWGGNSWDDGVAPTGWSFTNNNGGGVDFGVEQIPAGVGGGQIFYAAQPGTYVGYLNQTTAWTVPAAGYTITLTYDAGVNHASPGSSTISGYLYLGNRGTYANGVVNESMVPGSSTPDLTRDGLNASSPSSLETVSYMTQAGDIGKAMGVEFDFAQLPCTALAKTSWAQSRSPPRCPSRVQPSYWSQG